MTAVDAIAVVAAVLASVLAGVRWLRVAQREHYAAGASTRFALRWWLGFGPSRLLLAAAIVGVVLSPVTVLGALAGSAAIAVGPFKMSVLGRSPGRIVWTRRLRTLAAVTIVLIALVIAAGALAGAIVPVTALVALLVPVLVDAGCAIVAPFEDRLAERFVDAAKSKLDQSRPVVVAITGSYGKTSTKVYVAHLCGQSKRVVATPASFNNRAGLSRAINENLPSGTEVFVAEMGTYGPGEIAALCAWCPPAIAAITAIGPVHLERFGTEDNIVEAKSEIFGPARVAVLNVDDPRLARVADVQQARGLKVWRCSTSDAGADVFVADSGGTLTVAAGGTRIAEVAGNGALPGNVAVAVAIALELGVSPTSLGPLLATMPSVANRRAITTLSTGATAIDDTFNSNPAGSEAALEALMRVSHPGGKRVVVTPGMVELGPRQRDANVRFGAAIRAVATHAIVVGATNRAALLEGIGPTNMPVAVFDRHDDAVAWVRANTGAGDAVLYENQLPDHYP